jgi:type 1 glutamine amidotransferase
MIRFLSRAFPFASAAALLTLVILPLAGVLRAEDAKSEKAKPAKAKLKGLLITGGCCHDYPRQTEIITEGLSQRVSIEWDVVHEADDRGTKISIYEKPDWSKGYDVVVHNECYGSVDDVEFVEKIVKGHTETGIPAIVVHCSMHTYRAAQTDEWRKFLGVTSRRHERTKRSLDVVNAAPDSPIMVDFPKTWKTPNGELYIIENLWPNLKPLAKAYSPETESDQICIWTNTYGKARVFGTTLGHHNETMVADEWLDTVARGLLWAVDKLNDDGTPAAGYAGSGKGPLSFQVKLASGGEPTAADWSSSVKFPKSEKPVRLFNGKDFTGWEGHTDKYFSIDNGEIVAKNSADNAPKVSTYLLTKKKYRNFRLVFEGKLAKSKMHSGIALWGKRYKTGGEDTSYQGHLVMFPSNWGYYDLFRRNSIYKDDGRAKKADNGDWNRMEILAIGDRIRLAVNGQLVADWTDPKPELCEAGPLGLQLHSNKVPQEVRFRGLILSENPEDRMITVEKK